MSDLRAQVVEAMAQAIWRDQYTAVTRVPDAPHDPPEWDYDFMDVAEAALDAALDVLGERAFGSYVDKTGAVRRYGKALAFYDVDRLLAVLRESNEVRSGLEQPSVGSRRDSGKP